MTMPRLSPAAQLALMRHSVAAPTRPRLTLLTPTIAPVQSACPAPVPSNDEDCRDCVIRERHKDPYGRWIFVALDEKGWELDRGYAVSDAAARKVIARLWDVVYASRERRRPQLVP